MANFLENTPDEISEVLFRLGAIKVNLSKYFKLGSGDYSPLYCDARTLYSNVDARNLVCSRIVFWVNSHFKEVDAVVGVTSGGIGWAMTLANCNQLPLLYARKEPKDHGLHNQIEGELPKDGAKVVIIDDVITTGGSTLSVVDALRKGKNGKRAEVLGVFTVFDWDFTVVNKKFEDACVSKTRITTMESVVKYGIEHGLLSKGEFYQFNLSSCIRQQNSLTAQFVSFSLSNLANIFYPPPPIFTIINLCLL